MSNARSHRGGILLVEDDVLLADSTAELLRLWGYSVSVSLDGDSAVNRALEEGASPDVIVADYRLPGSLNGLESIDRIREIHGRTIPAIIVTGDAQLVPRGGELRVDCLVLYKPVETPVLQEALRLIFEADPDEHR